MLIKKKSKKIIAGIFLGFFSLGTAQAEEKDHYILSKMEAFRNLPNTHEIPKNLPLPAKIKIVDNLAFGGRFYMYEDDSSAHAPPEPTLELYAPYLSQNIRQSENELGFSLDHSVSKHACQKKLPYFPYFRSSESSKRTFKGMSCW